MWDKRAKVTDIHDGDTLTVTLDQGFGETTTIRLRLAAVYAPELNQTGGPETHAYVTTWLDDHAGPGTWPWVVTTARTPRSDVEVETFGRYVGTLTTPDGSDSLNAAVAKYVADNRYPRGVGG